MREFMGRGSFQHVAMSALPDIHARPACLPENVDPAAWEASFKGALGSAGINVSVVPPASTLLDSRARALPPLIRASVHYYNTDDELDRLITELQRLT